MSHLIPKLATPSSSHHEGSHHRRRRSRSHTYHPPSHPTQSHHHRPRPLLLLSREDQSPRLIRPVTPLIGSISDRDLLTENAKSHDAVIHCAMDMSLGREASAQQERETLSLFADALEGSGKALIMSSGADFLPPGSDEHSLPPTGHNFRAGTEVMLLGFKNRGIRTIAVRLAMNTHIRKSCILSLDS